MATTAVTGTRPARSGQHVRGSRRSDTASAPHSSQRNRWTAPLVAVGVIVLSGLWYLGYPFQTLMGDDLGLDYAAHTGGYASGFLSSFTQTDVGKFRPVVTPALYVVTHLFGGDYDAYRDVNVLLLALCVCLFGYLVWRVTGGRWLITIGAMAAATISRFAAYYVLQVWGLMESFALAFVLLTVIAVERAYREGKLQWLVVANVAYLFSEFSHERFILLFPFLTVAGLLAPICFRSMFTRLAWAAIPIGVAVFNYGVKTWILHINFLTAAGGQNEHFSLGQFFQFMRDGMASIVGYNTGPAYLSGQGADQLGKTGVAVAVVFAVPLFLVLVAAVVKDLQGVRREPVRLRKYVLAGALFLPVLATASITFRQEFRWLYAPFLVLLVGASWALAQFRPKHLLVMAVLALIVFGGSVTVDSYYHQYLSNTYFMQAQMAANDVRQEVIEQHRSELSRTTVFFVSADPSFGQWDLGNGEIFAIYAPNAHMDVRYVNEPQAVCRATDTRKNRLVFTEINAADVINTTSATLKLCGAA
jgi:hypothetical protein